MTEQIRKQQSVPTAFATPQAAAAADMTTVPDLATYMIGVVNDQYLYLTTPPAPAPTADGVNIIAPALPAGALFYRQFLRNLPAQYATAWWVDPVSGDDRNSGTSALAPLKSLEELGIRLRGAVINQNVTVTLLAGTLSNFSPFDITLGPGVLFTIQGDVTSTAPAALTAVQATVPGSNIRGTVTDPGGAFARSQRLRLTTGLNTGAITYCQGGTTSTTAITSNWTYFPTGYAPPLNVNPTAVTPFPSDNYVTDTLNSIFQGRMDIRVHGPGRMIWKDVRFTTDQTNFPAAKQNWRLECDVTSVTGVEFIACQFDSNWAAGFTQSTFALKQCLFQSFCGLDFGCFAGINSCVFQNFLSLFGNVTVQLSGPVTLDGGQILQTNGSFLEWNTAQIEVGATANGGVCWEIDPTCGTYAHSGALLWGPGVASCYSFMVRTYSDASFQYILLPIATGATAADARIAGNDRSWAQLPYVDLGHLSQAVFLP